MPERLHSRAGQGLSAGQRAVARRGGGRTDAGGDAADRADGPRDAGRGPHGGHLRPIAAAGGQRLELRLDVRDARRVPRPPRRRTDAATPSPPSSATACQRGSARGAGLGLRRPAGRRAGQRRRLQADGRGPRQPGPGRAANGRRRRGRRRATTRPAWKASSPACGPTRPGSISTSTGSRPSRWACRVGDVFDALQVYMGSLYVNNFNEFGRSWQVNVQADAQFPPHARRSRATEGPQQPRARWFRWARWSTPATSAGR